MQTLKAGKFAVPSWVCISRNLRTLTLGHSECSSYPALKTMPNLVELTLVTNKSCRQVPKAFGKSSGFHMLRYLVISDFPLLEEWPDLEDGSMILLELSILEWCPKLKKIPEGLERLGRLREFSYVGTGNDDEFRQKLR
ncbi:hypothetical protein SUGI_0894090 [Cryptomeria japonica]|nr:hypothetical protein SUGI_0894090 [Cryptomeria japonica]